MMLLTTIAQIMRIKWINMICRSRLRWESGWEGIRIRSTQEGGKNVSLKAVMDKNL